MKYLKTTTLILLGIIIGVAGTYSYVNNMTDTEVQKYLQMLAQVRFFHLMKAIL